MLYIPLFSPPSTSALSPPRDLEEGSESVNGMFFRGRLAMSLVITRLPAFPAHQTMLGSIQRNSRQK